MVSRENAVVLAALLVAVVAAYLVEAHTGGPDWLSLAVLIGLGVVVPTLLNEYLDRRATG